MSRTCFSRRTVLGRLLREVGQRLSVEDGQTHGHEMPIEPYQIHLQKEIGETTCRTRWLARVGPVELTISGASDYGDRKKQGIGRFDTRKG